MTPEETQLLSALVERVRSTQLLHTDSDAERMIRDLTAAKPEAAYILAQTVVMQDYALRQARARLDDLQNQLNNAQALAAQQAQAPRSGGFFSGLFGGGAAAAAPPPPAAGPWGGRPAAASYAQQGYAPPPPPPPNDGAQTGYAQYPAGGGQPSFLQGAAQTAMGVAGGALLFEGVSSLFGGHHGFGGGGFGGGFGDAAWGNGMPQETINETVVNNYYDGTSPSDSGYASSDYAAPDQGGFLDTSYDPGSDFDTGGFSDDDSSFT